VLEAAVLPATCWVVADVVEPAAAVDAARPAPKPMPSAPKARTTQTSGRFNVDRTLQFYRLFAAKTHLA